MTFNALEREKLGVLVNNISVYAAQLLIRNGPDLVARALTNLGKLRKEQQDLLRRLDGLARDQGEEMPLRLIEDMRAVPVDLAGMLSLVRRCLFASAFIGHLLAQPMHSATVTTDAADQAKRLQ